MNVYVVVRQEIDSPTVLGIYLTADEAKACRQEGLLREFRLGYPAPSDVRMFVEGLPDTTAKEIRDLARESNGTASDEALRILAEEAFCSQDPWIVIEVCESSWPVQNPGDSSDA